jgi:Fur family ferric uptake transcriptional regulator
MRASSVEKIILDTLSQEHTHMTPAQVYEEIRHKLPAVNQSTVYRALERLVGNGKVSVSDMGTGASVYELVTDKLHHHFVCQQCGHVMNISHEEIRRFFEKLEKKYQFEILTNHLILFGTCDNCLKDK